MEFTYSKRKDGVIVRSDGALIPEHQKDNITTKLYLEWLKGGGKLGEYRPTKEEADWERGQESIRKANAEREKETAAEARRAKK